MFRYALQIWDSPDDDSTIHYILLDEGERDILRRVLTEWEQAHVIESWALVRASDNAIYLSAFLGSKESTDRIKRYDDWLSGQEIPYDDGGGSSESASYRNAMTDAGRGHLLP